MEKILMCRICLIKDVRLYCLVNTHLQEIYEFLSGNLLETKDTRPLHACYMCCARLRNCLRLRTACLHSEELFSHLLENDSWEVTPSPGMNMLETTPVMNTDLGPVGHRELKMEPLQITDEPQNEDWVEDLQDDIIEQGIRGQFIKEEDMKSENVSSDDHELDYSIQNIEVESNSASDNSCIGDVSRESDISKSNHGISSVDLQNKCGKSVKIVLHRMDLNSFPKDLLKLLKIHQHINLETEPRVINLRPGLQAKTLKRRAINRPQLEHRHFPVRTGFKQSRCWMCAQRKVTARTIWKCLQCNVNLCIENCFMDYHI